jgi:hypothetical protein
MPILVICPSCKGRFQVSEKFAGKQGPCPKCKTVITIPKLDEQVKIHAPEEFAGGGAVAAKDARGRAVLKPIEREKSKIQPVVLIGAAAAALVAVVAAWLLRGEDLALWIKLIGAIALAPPLVLAGYSLLRNDDELEAYHGKQLVIRVIIISAVYVVLWGVSLLFQQFVFAGRAVGEGPEVWELGIPAGIMIVGGTIAAQACLDLETGSGFFHYAMYLVPTVLLRVIMGLSPL